MLSGFSAERLYFRRDRVKKLLDSANIQLETLIVDWEERAAELGVTCPPAPSRSTINSWMADGFPGFKRTRKNADTGKVEINPKFYQALMFCSLLDVDPLAIFDLERNGYKSRFGKFRKAIQYGFGGLGAYAPLFEMYAPDEIWPNDDLLRKYWNKNWCSFEFDNKNYFKSNDYCLIKVNFDNSPRELPRAVHISYRRWDVHRKDTMWRFYGSVVANGNNLELFNEGGFYAEMQRLPGSDIQFRTYFGGRNVEFRLVSLHEFSWEPEFPFNDMEVIGFEW